MKKNEIPFEDLSYPDKRRIFREYSLKNEIRDYVNIICDETVNRQATLSIPFHYENNRSVIYFQGFERNLISEEDYNKIYKIYNKIIDLMGFNEELNIWHTMKDFIIDGFISMEIIWDDKQQNIIGFKRLSPETLTPAYKQEYGNYWIQYQEDEVRRRILFDSQVIFVNYSELDNNNVSYINSLVRPFNQLKTIEDAAVLACIYNSERNTMLPMPDTSLIQYFSNSLKRSARIPTSTSTDVEKRSYNNYIKLLKNEFKKIIVKPLHLQLEKELPHIENIKTVNISL